MPYLLFVLFVLGFVFLGRALLIARGKINTKLFAKESFLFWQKTVAIVFLLIIILAIATVNWPFLTIAIINEFLNFLFYLQPTPRISKIILALSSLANLIFIIWLVVRIFV